MRTLYTFLIHFIDRKNYMKKEEINYNNFITSLHKRKINYRITNLNSDMIHIKTVYKK